MTSRVSQGLRERLSLAGSRLLKSGPWWRHLGAFTTLGRLLGSLLSRPLAHWAPQGLVLKEKSVASIVQRGLPERLKEQTQRRMGVLGPGPPHICTYRNVETPRNEKEKKSTSSLPIDCEHVGLFLFIFPYNVCVLLKRSHAISMVLCPLSLCLVLHH